ncbi:chloride channel protein [Bradyrhizobium barranii subsp. apii]|uniref:Chloride channel protein n=1 Tax=Bradyrhizobium barranii subsp. apii TaxID=2819348 RepID=A0A8T5V0U5_9BRAD|nr:hypothetical protein [Bradyrhizobium barranii]UPT87452.1 chloride channel protein [Bradyrhizobium barranii subsp. apii]
MFSWIWNNLHWLEALGFGAIIVGVCCWSRFDEPSYNGTAEYFTRYKPRFSTSRRRYARAKLGYECAILIVFVVFSAAPELFYALLPDNVPKPSETTLPLGIALIMVAFQTIPRLNEGERRIRGILHSVARIPESIRRTVAQLRGSSFNCSPGAVACQTRKLNMQIGKGAPQPALLSKLIFEDDLLHIWYSIGCVLSALSENNQTNTGIDPLFYETYKDELDSVCDRHIALAPPVRKYFAELLRTNSSPDVVPDPAVFREVKNLRDRLYTFVACGIRSSVTNDAESLDAISRLGFAIKPQKRDEGNIAALGWLSVVALLILSVFAVWATQVFIEQVLKNDPKLIDAFRVPTGLFWQFYWSWTTAAFYFFAIFGALVIRSVHVGRREWFDINDLERKRPIPVYAKSILLGGALGYVALVIIGLLGGPLFKIKKVDDIGDVLVEVVGQTLPWAPLAIVIAAIAISLSDSRFGTEQPSYGRLVARAAVGSLVMMFAGYLTSSIAYRNVHDHGAATIYMSLFIAAQIGLVTVVLCVVVQMSELYTDGARSFAGKYIEGSTRQGRQFCMFLNKDGTACLRPPHRGGLKSSAVLCQGRWQQFPEGTAVKWDREVDDCAKAGCFGLISAFGDSLIYEGYAERFSGTPDFVVQLNVRTSADASTKQPPPGETPPKTEPPAPRTSPAEATTSVAPH